MSGLVRTRHRHPDLATDGTRTRSASRSLELQLLRVATALREYATPNSSYQEPGHFARKHAGPLTGIIVANIVLVAGLALRRPCLGVCMRTGGWQLT